MTHLVILRNHSTDWYAGMKIHMVEDCLKHFTTNIIQVQIDTLREIPASFKDDNVMDYFGFLSRLALNGTCLAGFGLLSQIRDWFEAGSSIVTPAPSRLYFKNKFFYYFIFIL